MENDTNFEQMDSNWLIDSGEIYQAPLYNILVKYQGLQNELILFS